MKQNSRAKDVELILDQLNIMYEKEKTFDDLKYKHKLRFDYYLPKYHLCIEFNGVQHYEYVEYFHRDNAHFQQQIYKDGLKEKYCQDNSIYFLEIPCDLTRDEILIKLMNTLNKIGEFDFELLPRIDEFLELNESHKVYMNQLYDEYQLMLKQLNINHVTNYDTFNDYVIHYWDLTSQHLVKEKNKYYDCWLNENIEDMLDDNDVVLQHYLTVKEMGITSYSHIPTLVLYEHFKQWLRSVNPGAKPMHQRSYTKKMMQYFKEEGYTKAETKMIKKLDSSQFYLQFFENIAIDDSYRSKILIQPTSDQSNQAQTLIDDIKHNESNNSVISYINHADINMIRDRRVVFVYRQYEQYCEENALNVMGKQKFNNQLESRLNVVRKNRALKDLNQDETDLEAYTEEAINPDKRVKAWVEV